MRKVYLSIIMIGISAGSLIAQSTQVPYSFGDMSRNYKPAPQAPEESDKAMGTMIWSSDFSTPADWVIDNDGQTGSTYGWTVDATPDSWYFTSGMNSTSGGNFAELSNGDPTQGSQALNVTYTLTTAAGIDIPNLPLNSTSTDQVTLQFEQYGARFNDLQELQISTDGVTFTPIWNNNYHPVLSASAPNNQYPNPETVSINLAPYITGNANNFWIRFSWTTNYPSSASNPNVWVTYGWLIDDVQIWTNPDNDLEAQDPYWGTAYLNYYQIPLTQTAPIDFTTNAFNNGIAQQTNAVLNVNITGAETFSGTSQLANINPGAYDSLVLSTPFTPSTLGTYNVTWGITQDQVDDVPSNNDNADIAFDVTNYIYARDDNNPSGTNSNGGEGYEVGNLFDIWATQDVYSLDIKLSNTSNVGSILQGKIYYLDPAATDLATGLSQVAETNFHEVVAGDLSGILHLPLLMATQLDSNNTYLVVITTDGDGGATNDVVIQAAGKSDPQTSFFYDATNTTWYYTTNTPMIRLNFLNDVGLDENEMVSNLNAFPNPAVDNVTVGYALANASDIEISIVDLTGKTIAVLDQGTKDAGAHKLDVNTSGFAAGVYYINVSHNEGVSTTKFVKK